MTFDPVCSPVTRSSLSSHLRSGPGLIAVAASIALLAAASPLSAQVAAPVEAGRLHLSAGGELSYTSVEYGNTRIPGLSGFVDIDTTRSIGLEAVVHWMDLNPSQDVHVIAGLAGPRFHRMIGRSDGRSGRRFEIYGKALVGIGEFDFPYGTAYGRYIVLAPGGGVDYRLTRRVRLRVADAEYQFWPRFTFGAMTSYCVSAGVRLRIR
jgi:hypothetical protein